jgi:peptidoglycan hydrolase-like protein with peptidoglycan-binding domain
MLWLVMPASGSCQLLPGLLSSGPIAISQPVGRGPLARNKPDDVRTIQEALNRVTVAGAAGGPMPFLVVDGIVGPKTNAAIARFQQVQLKIFDGVIEPNKKTILKLNEILETVSDDDLKAKVRLALPIVARAIEAALRNLQAVIASSPGANGLAVTAADRLNRHFRLNALKPFEQSTARVELFSTYTRFKAVITNPELFNLGALDEFDLDKNNPKIALTRRNGFFQEGQEDPATHRRLDRIHLGLGFFASRVGPNFGAFIILHELSHFVGRANLQEIHDFGRGWFNEQFITPLTAEQRLANADSYATFAQECLADRPDKPPFVESRPGGLAGAR